MCGNSFFYAAVEEECTSGLVIEVSDDSDKAGADVVLLHGRPQSCMPKPVEGHLDVYEDMVEVLLVLEIILTEDSQIEVLLCGISSCSEACLFFSDDLLRLWLQSVQYGLCLLYTSPSPRDLGQSRMPSSA